MFTEAHETGNDGSQQEGDDEENDHELDYREKLLNVFTVRHSQRMHEISKPRARRHSQ